MADSKEYSTIVNCKRKLEIAFKSDRNIAHFLLQHHFITQECYDEFDNPKSTLTVAEKASMLVTAIRDRVELNPRNYHKVVDHLHQNIARYEDIIEILDQEYHRKTDPKESDSSGTNLQSGMLNPVSQNSYCNYITYASHRILNPNSIKHSYCWSHDM